jgi:hypothetical protein
MFPVPIVHRMEDVVPGSKRTIAFWRAKRPLVSLERALSPLRQLRATATMTVPALAQARARGRLDIEAKKKARFSEQ